LRGVCGSLPERSDEIGLKLAASISSLPDCALPRDVPG
jgi:hypothetical protein